jgi:hypothetical protein
VFQGNQPQGLNYRVMSDQQGKSDQVPLVPMNTPMIAANLAVVMYNSNNGSFSLNLIDQRSAPVNHVGDALRTANFEVGRFELTPRAVRVLEESIAKALAAYKSALGHDLQTIAQFDASAAMPGLENLIQPPKPSDPSAS